MPNYQNGKIYQVISPNHPVPYIGSTTQPLCKRIAGHRKSSNECSSRIVIDAGDAYIELIEEFPCETKEQLNKREGEIIRERECVNRKVEGRSQAEYYQVNKEAICEQRKQYRQANKEAICEQKKQYYQANKEAKAEYMKQYHRANKEAKAEYMKQYRQTHKEELALKKKQYQAKKKAEASHTEHTVTDLPQELEHSS